MLVSMICEKANTLKIDGMHPELNFIFQYYEKKYQKKITAFLSPKI